MFSVRLPTITHFRPDYYGVVAGRGYGHVTFQRKRLHQIVVGTDIQPGDLSVSVSRAVRISTGRVYFFCRYGRENAVHLRRVTLNPVPPAVMTGLKALFRHPRGCHAIAA